MTLVPKAQDTTAGLDVPCDRGSVDRDNGQRNSWISCCLTGEEIRCGWVTSEVGDATNRGAGPTVAQVRVNIEGLPFLSAGSNRSLCSTPSSQLRPSNLRHDFVESIICSPSCGPLTSIQLLSSVVGELRANRRSSAIVRLAGSSPAYASLP